MSYVPLPSENILFHDSVTVVSDSLSQIKSKLFEKTDSISAFFVVCTTSSSGLPKTAVCAVSAANETIASNGNIVAAINTHILRVILFFFIFFPPLKYVFADSFVKINNIIFIVIFSALNKQIINWRYRLHGILCNILV